MYLIMSAAYVDQELQSEFGAIPPSFLPLQNRRLFNHQLDTFPRGACVSLAIPESFLLSDFDYGCLIERGVEVIRVPDGLSLGAALVSALNLTANDPAVGNGLRVLLGDTLIKPLPSGRDVISVSEVEYSYNWTLVSGGDDVWLKDCSAGVDVENPLAVSGFFAFSDVRQLIRCVTRSNWDFIEGLNKYRNLVGLSCVQQGEWFDFGHANTYFDSKSKFTTERFFNDIEISAGQVHKRSKDSSKIRAEVEWYKSLPVEVQSYTPRVYSSSFTDTYGKYILEYLHCSALNELFVFSNLPFVIWKKILNRCLLFIELCKKVDHDKLENYNFINSLVDKTARRLNSLDLPSCISMDINYSYNGGGSVSIKKIQADVSSYLRSGKLNDYPSIVHGDFCFSNILFDFRVDDIKVIDPRGLDFDGSISIYGDMRYDLAKLSHSIVGLYDWIVAGYSSVSISEKEIEFKVDRGRSSLELQSYFFEEVWNRFGIGRTELYAIQIHLFLSMLPLHSDNELRQLNFIANVYRLYFEIKEEI